MSPKNLHIPDVMRSVSLPEAPSQTRRGKTIAMQNISYSPLKHSGLTPGINGTKNSSSKTIEQIQNAPPIFIGLKLRCINIPSENGKSILNNPPIKLAPSNVHPTLKHP